MTYVTILEKLNEAGLKADMTANTLRDTVVQYGNRNKDIMQMFKMIIKKL